MVYNFILRAFVFSVTALSFAVLIYVYAFPPKSTRLSREGVPFFTPSVVNPETGEALDVKMLARHFRGE